MWKTISKETKLKIYDLLMNEYQEQLFAVKKDRVNMTYNQYRKKYMKIHNRFSAIRRKIAKLKKED